MTQPSPEGAGRRPAGTKRASPAGRSHGPRPGKVRLDPLPRGTFARPPPRQGQAGSVRPRPPRGASAGSWPRRRGTVSIGAAAGSRGRPQRGLDNRGVLGHDAAMVVAPLRRRPCLLPAAADKRLILARRARALQISLSLSLSLSSITVPGRARRASPGTGTDDDARARSTGGGVAPTRLSEPFPASGAAAARLQPRALERRFGPPGAGSVVTGRGVEAWSPGRSRASARDLPDRPQAVNLPIVDNATAGLRSGRKGDRP